MKCNFYLLVTGYVILHVYKVISIHHSGMECFHQFGEKKIVNCISKDDSESEIKMSIDKITGHEEIEELTIDLGERTVWEIDISNFYIFANFKNLSKLIIKSKFLISQRRFGEFYKGDELAKAKRTFIDRLFNMVNLQHLEVQNCQFTDEFNWTLPKSLLYLSFLNNSYTTFDLRNQPLLAFVNFGGNNLTRIPKFSELVPSPITELNLNNNHFLEITFGDIAPLCQLRSLSLNKFNEHLSDDEKNCRCEQLKEWIKLHDVGSALRDKPCGDQPSECSNSLMDMDEAENKYKKCMAFVGGEFVQNSLAKSTKGKDPFLEWYHFWYSWLLIVISLLSIFFFSFLFYGVLTFVVQAQNDNMLDSDPASIYNPYITEDAQDELF